MALVNDQARENADVVCRLQARAEKIKNLTPIQNTKKSYKSYAEYKKKHEFKILNETKAIHKKKGHFTKEEIKEYSALFIIIELSMISSK